MILIINSASTKLKSNCSAEQHGLLTTSDADVTPVGVDTGSAFGTWRGQALVNIYSIKESN